MARQKKTDVTAAQTKTRGRTRKSKPKPAAGANGAVTAKGPDLAQAEREFVQRYPHLNVVPGSLRPGAAEGWGTKRIFDLTCPCGATRAMATSDAHTSDGLCLSCSRAARKAKKQKAS